MPEPVETLQGAALRLSSSLSSGGEGTAEDIRQLHDNVAVLAGHQPARPMLRQLQSNILAGLARLRGLPSRTEVQTRTMTSLQSLHARFLEQGVGENFLNAAPDMVNNILAHDYSPHTIMQRMGVNSTVSMALTGLGIYWLGRHLLSGGRRMRGFFRSTWGSIATHLGIGALGYWMGSRNATPPPLTAEEQKRQQDLEKTLKEQLEKLNKANVPVDINSTELNGINLLNLTAPVRVNNVNISLVRHSNVSRLRINNVDYDIEGINMMSNEPPPRIMTINNRRCLAIQTVAGLMFVPVTELAGLVGAANNNQAVVTHPTSYFYPYLVQRTVQNANEFMVGTAVYGPATHNIVLRRANAAPAPAPQA